MGTSLSWDICTSAECPARAASSCAFVHTMLGAGNVLWSDLTPEALARPRSLGRLAMQHRSQRSQRVGDNRPLLLDASDNLLRRPRVTLHHGVWVDGFQI